VCTESAGTEQAAAFQPGAAYEKHPRVAIRHEEFGGLAYHYDHRRLVFLKSSALVDVVESLAEFPTAAAALATGVPAPEMRACAAALPALLAADVIRPRPGDGPAVSVREEDLPCQRP
jgi:putative mycofactocin binding protein MftB